MSKPCGVMVWTEILMSSSQPDMLTNKGLIKSQVKALNKRVKDGELYSYKIKNPYHEKVTVYVGQDFLQSFNHSTNTFNRYVLLKTKQDFHTALYNLQRDNELWWNDANLLKISNYIQYRIEELVRVEEDAKEAERLHLKATKKLFKEVNKDPKKRIEVEKLRDEMRRELKGIEDALSYPGGPSLKFQADKFVVAKKKLFVL